VGILDFLREIDKQSDEKLREKVNKLYKNNPVERDRAIRKLDALAKASPPLQAQKPDLSKMTTQELEILHQQTEHEIEAVEKGIASARQFSQKTSDRLKDTKHAIWGDLLEMFTGSDVVEIELIEKKKLLVEIEAKLKSPPAPAATSPQAKRAEIQRLEQERDDFKAKRPQASHADIDRLYDQLIDDVLNKP
jgi:hypothetical protein